MRRIVENIRFGLFLVVLICVLAAALFWALSIGTVHLSLSQIYGAIVQQLESGRTIEAPGQGPVHDIVWLLRLPRLVLAALVGAGLSVCGVVMQAIVKNPLADPYILGISSGASLGATAAILLGVGAFLTELRRHCRFHRCHGHIPGGALYFQSRRPVFIGEAPSGGHGPFGGVLCLFQLHCVLCQRQGRYPDHYLLAHGQPGGGEVE